MTKLAFLGDIHGFFAVASLAANRAKGSGCAALIQVGDFGFYPQLVKQLCSETFHLPTYWIDGNHEHFPFLGQRIADEPGDVIEVHDNLFYVRRGSDFHIENVHVAFLGGAGSVDYKWRALGHDWWLEEQISDADIDRFNNVGSVDVLVTHTPPTSVIKAKFDPLDLMAFDLSPNWSDPSATQVEVARTRLGNPFTVCGHMHRSVEMGSVRILNINEYLEVEF